MRVINNSTSSYIQRDPGKVLHREEQEKKYLDYFLPKFCHLSPFICSLGSLLGAELRVCWNAYQASLQPSGGKLTCWCIYISIVGWQSIWCAWLATSYVDHGYPKSVSVSRVHSGGVGVTLIYTAKAGK